MLLPLHGYRREFHKRPEYKESLVDETVSPFDRRFPIYYYNPSTTMTNTTTICTTSYTEFSYSSR